MRILEISLQILFITIVECLKTFIKKDFFIFIHICCWFCRAQNVAQRKRFVKLVDSVRECGGDVKIFSSMHISGERKLLMLYQHLSITIILYIGNIFLSSKNIKKDAIFEINRYSCLGTRAALLYVYSIVSNLVKMISIIRNLSVNVYNYVYIVRSTCILFTFISTSH